MEIIKQKQILHKAYLYDSNSNAEAKKTDETGQTFLSCKIMLTSHRLPSIEKIKPVAYGDVGNKQTDRQLRHKDQASQTKKYNSVHC